MRIGILGLGSIGKHHMVNLQRRDHTVLVYDPAYPDYGLTREQVLEEAEALIIASPTAQHARDILDTCARPNLPILVEKPLITPYVNELHAVSNVLRINKTAYTGFNLRFHSCVKKARGWLPLIGPPRWAHFIVAQRNTKYDDDVISNWASHEIDLALHLLGPGKVIYAHGNRECALLAIEHESGCRSSIQADYVLNPEMRGFVIAGDRTLEVDLVRRYARLSECVVFTGNDSWDTNYYAELVSFLEDATPECATWQDGAAVVDIVIQARQMAGIE